VDGPTARPASHAGTARPGRRVDVIAAELADVRRYLAETPPHHGDGTRVALEERVQRLERELAAARAGPTGEDR
jgi:hypothetical protein